MLSDKERQVVECFAAERAALAEAAQSPDVLVVGEVVEWQYRRLSPEEFTGQPASLLEWQRVIPYLSQSNEKRLEELLAYRSHGKACYEIRALVVQPTTSITATELQRLRKDAERYRWLRDSPDSPIINIGYATDKMVDAAIAQEKVE